VRDDLVPPGPRRKGLHLLYGDTGLLSVVSPHSVSLNDGGSLARQLFICVGRDAPSSFLFFFFVGLTSVHRLELNLLLAQELNLEFLL